MKQAVKVVKLATGNPDTDGGYRVELGEYQVRNFVREIMKRAFFTPPRSMLMAE
jgi:hypothetical protein